MVKINTKTLALLLTLSCGSFSAFAQLNAPKLDINVTNGDKAIITASFPSATKGDLYFAVDFGGQYLFFTEQGGISGSPVPFIANGSFSQAVTVLDMAVPAALQGTYTFYQVVANAGSNVFDITNWNGGLSQITLTVSAPPAVVTPVSNVALGKSLYKSLTCSSSSCHGINPKLNKDRVLSGDTVVSLRSAIRKNPTDMGFLSTTSDADLQAIADYLSSCRTASSC